MLKLLMKVYEGAFITLIHDGSDRGCGMKCFRGKLVISAVRELVRYAEKRYGETQDDCDDESEMDVLAWGGVNWYTCESTIWCDCRKVMTWLLYV